MQDWHESNIYILDIYILDSCCKKQQENLGEAKNGFNGINGNMRKIRNTPALFKIANLYY